MAFRRQRATGVVGRLDPRPLNKHQTNINQLRDIDTVRGWSECGPVGNRDPECIGSTGSGAQPLGTSTASTIDVLHGLSRSFGGLRTCPTKYMTPVAVQRGSQSVSSGALDRYSRLGECPLDNFSQSRSARFSASAETRFMTRPPCCVRGSAQSTSRDPCAGGPAHRTFRRCGQRRVQPPRWSHRQGRADRHANRSEACQTSL